MTEQELARQLHTLVNQLNQALGQAASAGLRIDVSVDDWQTFGNFEPTRVVRLSAYRRLGTGSWIIKDALAKPEDPHYWDGETWTPDRSQAVRYPNEADAMLVIMNMAHGWHLIAQPIEES